MGVNVNGGGILNDVSSPEVRNCRIESNVASSYGGGMYNFQASPVVEDCTFEGNEANWGGGMYNDPDSIATVTGSTFLGNLALSYGGGVYHDDSDATYTGCEFIGNSADRSGSSSYGGGLYLRKTTGSYVLEGILFRENYSRTIGGGATVYGADVIVRNCRFFGNDAGYGGAASASSAGTIAFESTIFADNTAHGGGAIRLEDSSDNMFEFHDCLFTGNRIEYTGTMYIYGGAIYARRGNLTFTDTYFTGNATLGTNGYGGALCVFVGDYTYNLENTVFVGNNAEMGSAIAKRWSGSMRIYNSTFVGNVSYTSDPDWQSPMSRTSGFLGMYNGISWGNTPVSDPYWAEYSDIHGGLTGTGNINMNPLFAGYPLVSGGSWSYVLYDDEEFQTVLVDDLASWTPGEFEGLFIQPDDTDPNWYYIVSNTATTIRIWGLDPAAARPGSAYRVYDLHLTWASPCIDAANGDTSPTLDLDGNPRVDSSTTPNTGVGTPDYVDMGAFEYQP
jgi:hypothetical protein